jgi:hypothetical protein
MKTQSQYFIWILVAVLLWFAWHHSHWSVALALTVLFVWHLVSRHVDSLAFSDLFLYSSEYWKATLLPDEAAIRLEMAKRFYDEARKERLKVVKKYNDTASTYAASIKNRPDLPISALDKVKGSLAIAEERVKRAYENLEAAGGE